MVEHPLTSPFVNYMVGSLYHSFDFFAWLTKLFCLMCLGGIY